MTLLLIAAGYVHYIFFSAAAFELESSPWIALPDFPQHSLQTFL
jgi:hypothetical protein